MKTLKKDLKIHSLHYTKILAILKRHEGNSRLIGGCVRDALLGFANPDIDIATTLHPERVMEILEEHNITVVPTGIKFGTVTAFTGKEKFEITTLRTDIKYRNGRHPEVEFNGTFKSDAARRDFTINALSYCPFEKKVYDYFDGLADLENSRVVFIGDPFERIAEDLLRILRFFRFSCLYAKNPDKAGLTACIELKSGLKFLSQERIKMELDKLISIDSSPDILQIMHEKNILAEIIPFQPLDVNLIHKAIKIAKTLEIIPEPILNQPHEFKAEAAERTIVHEHSREPKNSCGLFKMGNGIRLENYCRYGLLFYEALKHDTKQALKILRDLKFSNQEAKDIVSIISFVADFKKEKAGYFFKKIWFEKHKSYLQYIVAAAAIHALTVTKIKEFHQRYGTLAPLSFPVKGNDLAALSLQGKQINEALKKLKTIWIESDFQLSKEQLLEKVK